MWNIALFKEFLAALVVYVCVFDKSLVLVLSLFMWMWMFLPQLFLIVTHPLRHQLSQHTNVRICLCSVNKADKIYNNKNTLAPTGVLWHHITIEGFMISSEPLFDEIAGGKECVDVVIQRCLYCCMSMNKGWPAWNVVRRVVVSVNEGQ